MQQHIIDFGQPGWLKEAIWIIMEKAVGRCVS